MSIRPMIAADIPFAAGCAAAEGWTSETAEEFEGFRQYAPEGALVAEEDGEPIGMCVATPYRQNGFIGELIVVPAWRGRGIGRRLIERAIAFLRGRGIRSILLDAVPQVAPLYRKLGFVEVCRSLRFLGRPVAGPRPGVRRMMPSDLEAALRIDHRAFGEDRGFFLQRRVATHPALCWLAERQGRVTGFVQGRPGLGVVSAGPWLLTEPQDPGDRSVDLLEALASQIGDLPLRIGVLELNRRAVRSIERAGCFKPTQPSIRMVLGAPSRLGQDPALFAVGSPAKG